MTEINIEGVTFQIKQLSGVHCVFDNTDNMVGRADSLPDAVKICEQIAWRRIIVEQLTKDAVGDEKSIVVDEKSIVVDKAQRIKDCGLCKHNSICLVVTDDSSAVLKRKCALNVRYDDNSRFEIFAMEENINDRLHQQRDY